MPKTWDPLLAAVARHLAVHNGKLVTFLGRAYEIIHIGGYYHGELQTPGAVKDAFDIARRAIESLSGRRIS